MFYNVPWILRMFLAPLFTFAVEGGGGGGAGDGGGGAGGGGTAVAGGGGGAAAGGGGGAGDGGGGGTAVDLRTFMDAQGNFVKPEAVFAQPEYAHLAKRFSSLPTLAKSYVSLERQLSNGNKVAVPNENSLPEEWDAFFAKVGRPAKADDYKIEKPEALKDVGLDDASLAEFRQLAHKNGFTGKQVEQMAKWYFDTTAKAMTQYTQQQEQAKAAAVDALKKEWGGNYDAQIKLAQAAAKSLGGDELLSHPLANDPAFIKVMAKVGAMVSEDKLAGGRQTGVAPTNPSEEINRILGDKTHPYWNPKHPSHETAVQQMQRLYALKYPEA